MIIDLDLSFCRMITESSFSHIARYCLRLVNLKACNELFALLLLTCHRSDPDSHASLNLSQIPEVRAPVFVDSDHEPGD